MIAFREPMHEVAGGLIDSGAAYTLLPYEVWRTLGLLPKRAMTFALADGT